MAIDPIYNLKFTTVASVGGNDITVADPTMLRDDVSAFIDNDFLVWAAGETPTPSNSEYVRPTADASGTFTLSRQQQGSSLRTITVGDYIALAPTKLTFDQLQSQIDDKFASADVIDEDDMASDSATKVPTQQSVKAYVDANAGGGGTTLPSQTGNAGKYLKTDGSALSWDTPAGGGGGSSTPRFQLIYPGMPNAVQISNSITGSSNITANGNSTRYRGSGGYIDWNPFTPQLNLSGSGLKNLSGSIICSTDRLAGATNGSVQMHWFGNSSYGASNDNTGHQIGLDIVGAATSDTVRSTTGNGTTATVTTLASVNTYHQDYLFTFQRNASDVKFYVDGTLKNTHTTNLPTVQNGSRFFTGRATESGGAGGIFCLDFFAGSWTLSGDIY